MIRIILDLYNVNKLNKNHLNRHNFIILSSHIILKLTILLCGVVFAGTLSFILTVLSIIGFFFFIGKPTTYFTVIVLRIGGGGGIVRSIVFLNGGLFELYPMGKEVYK